MLKKIKQIIIFSLILLIGFSAKSLAKEEDLKIEIEKLEKQIQQEEKIRDNKSEFLLILDIQKQNIVLDRSNLFSLLKDEKSKDLGTEILRDSNDDKSIEDLIKTRKEYLEIIREKEEKKKISDFEILMDQLLKKNKRIEKIDTIISLDSKLEKINPLYKKVNKEYDKIDNKISILKKSLKDTEKKLQEKIKEAKRKEEQKKREEAKRKAEEAAKKAKTYTKLIKPVNSSYISSYFGNRPNPFTNTGSEFHSGIDWPAPLNTPIKAAGSGIITKARKNGGYGNFIEIRHTDNMVTRYGHLNSYNVVEGQEVSRGDIIGYMGTTGRSTGSHLHFEVKINGKVQNPLNFVNN